MCFQELCFNIVHQNASIRRRKFGPNSFTWYLLIKFTIEFKKIIFKNKIRHFYNIFSGNQFDLEFIVLFSKDFETSIMWNTWKKPKHICCNKDWPFRNFIYSLKFSRKSPVSFTDDLPCFMSGCKWWSKFRNLFRRHSAVWNNRSS